MLQLKNNLLTENKRKEHINFCLYVPFLYLIEYYKIYESYKIKIIIKLSLNFKFIII